MQKLNDLSRTLSPLEPDGTLIAVIVIRIDYHRHHLGVFKTFDDAVAARRAAERQRGYSSQ